MRLKKFLREEGEGGAPGGGGEGYSEVGSGATTTPNVSPFWNKVMKAPVRRKKKLKKKKELDIDKNLSLNDNILLDLYEIATCNHLNEDIVPDFIFNNIQSAGKKVGFKIKRSDTLFDYLASGGKEIVNLFNLICLYIIASEPEKTNVKNDIKTELKKINRRRLIAFILQIDKLSFGLTSIVRHILMAVFGLEVTTYNKWAKDIEYIMTHLDKIKKVLMSMNPTPEEIQALDNLYDVILKTKEEVEKNKGSN